MGWHGLAAHSDGIEKLGPGQENDPGAGRRQQPAAIAWILSEILLAALDRAEGDDIGHHPRFEAGLDLEKPSDFSEHRHR
jgi:hypothetical protein